MVMRIVVVPGAPGFVWDARIAMVPVLSVFVRAALDGRGSMQGAILGIKTVVDSQGMPAIAAAALQRYLGEAVWFPTAWRPSQGVRWIAIDDSRARANISGSGVTVSLEIRFGPDGLIESVFAPDRIYDDGKSPPVPRFWTAGNFR